MADPWKGCFLCQQRTKPHPSTFLFLSMNRSIDAILHPNHFTAQLDLPRFAQSVSLYRPFLWSIQIAMYFSPSNQQLKTYSAQYCSLCQVIETHHIWMHPFSRLFSSKLLQDRYNLTSILIAHWLVPWSSLCQMALPCCTDFHYLYYSLLYCRC